MVICIKKERGVRLLIEDNWRNLEWLRDGRSLIDWISNVEDKAQVILFVRHSHRLHSEDQHELLHMQLTPLGHEMAREFGKHLPRRGHLEIFHSEHPRCLETAEGILKGYQDTNQLATIRGPIRELLGPQVVTSIGKELSEYGIDGFINRWAKGEFPESQIESIQNYGERIWTNTVVNLNSNSTIPFYVHVSHDLVLMSFRKTILGINATHDNWIPFLGGFGIIKIEDNYQWIERGEVYEVNGFS